MIPQEKPDALDLLLRIGAFALVAFVTMMLVSSLLTGLDDVTRSASASFLAGLTANFVVATRFGRGSPAEFGFGWTPDSGRIWAVGTGIGTAAVAAIVVGSVALGWARYETAPFDWTPLAIVAVLLAGATGEELLFRGYAFQLLARSWPSATIAVTGALFGFLHLLSNPNIQAIGALNTALWGVLLGYARVRTGTLWLPAGLHFGWNLALALLTSNLSGITIKASGWDLRWSANDLWSGGLYGLEGGLLTTILAAFVFLAVRRVR